MPIAYIALGSNLVFAGCDPSGTIQAAIEALESLGDLVAQSSFYETAPVGFRDQPAFVNAVVSLETGLSAELLLGQLLDLERRFGRDRLTAIPNGPRTLDLDLLMLDQQVLASDRLTLPHPRLAERRFVLQPLAEIAPGLRHPVLQDTMRQLLQRLPDSGSNCSDGVKLLP